MNVSSSSKTISLRLNSHLPAQPNLVGTEVGKGLFQVGSPAYQPVGNNLSRFHELLNSLRLLGDKRIRFPHSLAQRFQLAFLPLAEGSEEAAVKMIDIIEGVA